MAFRCLNLLKNVRCSTAAYRCNMLTTSITEQKINKSKTFKTERNITFLEDPDTFGTLSGRKTIDEKLEDEDDVKEETFLQDIPLESQKLTTKQYADLIKQYLKYKRIKEAIDILEVRMLKEDRVKPENYIYNILIGACAEVGYTKKAFKLFNDMKRRALKPTGDTYTCLFESCINSPFPAYGLKMATHLRNLMIEKGIEPNITNFNVMIKTFGRLTDLPTAFKIVDEMISKKIKIRVHTFNHLLQACITNKESGLKQALVVWRKMLKMRERPNLYSFNLMIKCVKECNIGTKEDFLDVIGVIQEHNILLKNANSQMLQIESSKKLLSADSSMKINNTENTKSNLEPEIKDPTADAKFNKIETNVQDISAISSENRTDLAIVNENIKLEFIEKPNQRNEIAHIQERTVPNLLSKLVQMDKVLAFQEVNTVQDKFAMIGGQDDFLKEMEAYGVKPDIKTITQMLSVIDDNVEAENKLIEYMKTNKIKADIDFYNMLIKRRCLRLDYTNAIEVKNIILRESKLKTRHPWNKKHKLNMNIMTYGVLAMACSTKENAMELLDELKEKQLKVNIEILGTLLKNGTNQMKFGYVLYIIDVVKQENLKVNDKFIKHLEAFNDKCLAIIEKNKRENKESPIFEAAFNNFSTVYNKWLNEINIEEALKPEHPWKQFMEPQPTPMQRENFKIEEPRKFYKRSRKFVRYTVKV